MKEISEIVRQFKEIVQATLDAVSYTHLDVYKRQYRTILI